MPKLGFLQRVRKYPITAIVKTPVGIEICHISRVVEKDQSEVHLIKETGEKIRPIPTRCMERGKKGKIYAFLESPDKGVYYAAKWKNPSDIKIHSKEMDTWRILQHAKSRIMFPGKQSFLEKYLPIILYLIAFGSLGFIVLFMMREFSSVASSIATASGNFAEAARVIGAATSGAPLT